MELAKNLGVFWYNNGFEIMCFASLMVIIILGIFNLITKKKGEYDDRSHLKKQIFENSTFDELGYFDSSDIYSSKLEMQAKIILEHVFKRPFVKIRPSWLNNEVTGKNLEIDLYNEHLRLGVEVMGNQHYKYTPFFQKNKEAFYNQRYRDEIKKLLCQKRGICLIEIPYDVGEKGLKSYILTQLRIHKYIY